MLPIRLDVTEMAQVDAQVDLWLPTLLAADPSRWTDFPGPLRAQGLLPGIQRIFHGASATLSLVPAKHQIKTMEWSEIRIREDGTGFEEPVVAELSCGWPSQTAVGAGSDSWQVPSERPR
ncbi:MAG: hypothetical protein AAFZ65_08695 [Planctomycetota bacterium]